MKGRNMTTHEIRRIVLVVGVVCVVWVIILAEALNYADERENLGAMIERGYWLQSCNESRTLESMQIISRAEELRREARRNE